MKSRSPATGFILVTLFLDTFGIGLIIPVLPKLVENFQGGSVSAAADTIGLLMALFSLMQFLFAPVLGSLSDHFGRRPVLLISLFGAGLDYLLLAWAPSLSWFYAGRIIAGISGANFSTAGAYIADVSPPEKRAHNFGLIGAAFGFGFIAGPALGGLLGSLGLRVPFLAAAALALINWLYGLLILPESLPRENRRTFSWRRANPAGSLLALKRFPVVLGLAATLLLMNLAYHVLHSTWVLYTGYRYQWSPAQVGMSLAVIGIMATLVQGGLVRHIVPVLGERRALLVGLLINAVNFLGYGLATQGWMIYAILVVGSLGAISGPAVQALISKNVPVNEQGAIQGAVAGLSSLAGIIGPPIFTHLFGYFISPRAPFQLPGAALFFGALLMLLGLLFALWSFRKPVNSPGTY
jgi:MFS transporter, DHA1 family, tetracycline resistance protein